MNKFVLIFVIIFLMIFLSIPISANNTTSRQILDKKNQLKYIQSEIQQNQNAIEKINQESTNVLKEIEQIDLFVKATQEEINKIEDNIKQKENYIRNMEYQKNINNQKLRSAKESFDHIGSEITGDKNVNYWEWSLKTDSALLLNLRIEQLKEVHNVYDMAINKNWYDQVDIRSKEGTAQLERVQLEKDKKIVEQKKKFIQDQLDKKLSIFSTLTYQKNEFIDSIDDLQKVSNDLEVAINRLQSLGYSSNIGYGKGVMIWPSNGGNITSPYGPRVHPINKTESFHTGIDIGGLGFGKPVYATADGIIITAGWVSGYGNTVIIDHGNRISTLYGHNSKLLVQAGQEVSQGQKIAEVGSTGLSTGPHIHYEVRVNGKTTNPMEWF